MNQTKFTAYALSVVMFAAGHATVLNQGAIAACVRL